MIYNFITPGFFPTSIVGTPTNAQLEQMVQEAKPATTVGFIVYADTAPDVVTYPDLATSLWHKTTTGAATGYLYYYNGTAWTPLKVSPGALSGDAFVDGTIAVAKLTPGTPFYVVQTNGAGTTVVWTAPVDLFDSGSLPWSKFYPASGQDYFMVSSPSGTWTSATKEVAANLMAKVATAAVITSFSDLADDGVVTAQAVDGTLKSVSHQTYLELLTAAFNPITATAVGDKIAVYQSSATALNRMKTVTLDNLCPPTGVTAGTYGDITVRADGRISAIDTTKTVTTYATTDANLVALPTGVGYANAASIPHGLGARPSFCSVRLVCTDAAGDAGWAQNDEVEIAAVLFDEGGGSDYNPGYVVVPTTTAIMVMQPIAVSGRLIVNKGTGVTTGNTFTPTKWKLRGFAIK